MKSLDNLLDYMILILLCFAPLVILIGLFPADDLVHPIISVQISLAEILILIVFGLFFLKVLLEKSWRQLKWPPIAILLYLSVILLSSLNATSNLSIIKEFLQNALYFFLFYIVLINRPNPDIFLRKARIILVVLTCLSILVACYQTFIEGGSPYLIRGLFVNRNLFGGFLVLTLPLIFIQALHTHKIWLKVFYWIVMLLAFAVIYAPFAVIAAFIALFCVAWFHLSRNFKYILLLFLPIILSLIFSSQYRQEWKNALSVYEQGSVGLNYNRVQRLLYDLPKNTWLQKNMDDKVLLIEDELFMSSVEPQTRLEDDQYTHLKDRENIKQRYLEWYATLNMVSEQPVIGFGAGQYQDFVGSKYGTLIKVNTMEPNCDNSYLVTASTLGILGLSALLWILFYHFMNALKMIKTGENEQRKIQGLWIVGSFIGIGIYGFFSSFLVVGIMPFLVLLLSISYE